MDIISYGLAKKALDRASKFNIKQVTKLGITGSDSNPYITDIVLEHPTIDYLKPAPSVLMIVTDMGSTGGDENIVKVLSTFSNGDETDFNHENDGHIIFDGQMKLNTIHPSTMVKDTSYTGTGGVYRLTIDRTKLTNIKNIEVTE